MGNKHYWVYIHINKKNGKRYVGITTQDTPEMRWGTDGYCYRKQPVFYNAIKKYGWRGFDHIAVAVESEEKMLWMEKHLIQVWNTVEAGYNATYGGEENCPSESTKKKMSKAAYARGWNGENNPLFGRKLSDSTKKKIGDANRGKTRSEEFRKAMSEIAKNRESTGHAIIQCDKDWNPIKRWSNVKELKKVFKYTEHISDCCRGNRASAYGYKWKYEDYEPKKKENHLTAEGRERMQKQFGTPVCALKDGEIIFEFPSAAEASRQLGIGAGKVSSCCNGAYGRKTVKGYEWKWKRDCNIA